MKKIAHENSSSKLIIESNKTQTHKTNVLVYCHEPKSMNEILKFLKLNLRGSTVENEKDLEKIIYF